MVPARSRDANGCLALACVAVALAGAYEAASAGEPPDVIYTTDREFNLSYERADDLAKVELYVTQDGGATWEFFGFDPDTGPKIGYTAERDGTYGFWIVLEDLAGNRSTTPVNGTLPQLVVVIDTTPPKVELLSPRGGAFGPSRGIDVAWRASDEYLGEKPVTVLVSRDAGKTWVEASGGLPSEGSFAWRMKELPPAGVKGYRFRAVAVDQAGNRGEATSPDDCLLDEAPPVVRVAGPVESTTADVNVVVSGDDEGGSGIESVRLYVSMDDGATWHEAASSGVPSDPLVWRAPRSGTYGFYAAATDGGGNVQPAPSPGAKPQLYTEVKAVGPMVALKTLNTGGYYRGGATQPIVWEADGNGLNDKSVSLHYSQDAGQNWTLIASDLPTSGQFPWTVPTIDSKTVVIRVTAVSDTGESNTDESDRFLVVDSTPPRSVARFEVASVAGLAPKAVATPPLPNQPETPRHKTGTAFIGNAPPQDAPPPVPAEYVKATDLLAKKNYKDAAELLEGLLAREPGNARAHLALGEARARQTDALARDKGLSPTELLRRYDEAASSFRRVVKIDEESNDARVWLGLCLYQRGEIFHKKLRRADAAAKEWDLAATEFEKALAIQPNLSDEYFYSGVVYYRLSVVGAKARLAQNADRAEELLERSLVGSNKRTAAGAQWYLAELAEAKKDSAGAVEHWRKALELYGENAGRAGEIRARIQSLGGR
jgi:tetratricopeptide (TPR) repeat protein